MKFVLLQETGFHLHQEDGFDILLDVWYPISATFLLEVRTTAGALLAMLGNAYGIYYQAKLNAPHILKFSLPADDTNASLLTVVNEVWLRHVKKNTIVRKFRIVGRGDNRD